MNSVPDSLRPWIVWRMTNGKAGHNAQTVGLVTALNRIHPVVEHLIAPARFPIGDLVLRRFPEGMNLPDPDLLIGAGHTTHLALIAAKRARGGRTVVLMHPSIPSWLFDLCLVPEHDRVPPTPHVFLTKGVLNAIELSACADPRKGLLLIGGPSRHFGWSNPDIAAQIARIVSSTPDVNWTLTTSRRTPAEFLEEILDVRNGNLSIVPHEETEPGWVACHMRTATQIWVSEDSASMVYEALSSGAGVGLLSCPNLGKSRISEGVNSLQEDGLVKTYTDWRPGEILSPPPEPFAEADRCARYIAERWLSNET